MISGVGYLHENPEIGALLLHKGIQAIDEDELLQIIDVALSLKITNSHAYDAFAQSHVLTGLETLGLRELRKKNLAGETPPLKDPRASVLAGSLDGDLGLKGKDDDLSTGTVKATSFSIIIVPFLAAIERQSSDYSHLASSQPQADTIEVKGTEMIGENPLVCSRQSHTGHHIWPRRLKAQEQEERQC